MNDAQFDDIWNKYDQVKKTKTLNNGKVWPANPIERKQLAFPIASLGESPVFESYS